MFNAATAKTANTVGGLLEGRPVVQGAREKLSPRSFDIQHLAASDA